MAGAAARLRRTLSFFLLLQNWFVAVAETRTEQQQCSTTTAVGGNNYHHMIVLVHGYLGSSREQEYLGEKLIGESKKLLGENTINDNTDGSCHPRLNSHNFAILNSKANMKDSTDGVINGGKRLAAEISEWIKQQIAEVRQSELESESDSKSTAMTFSMIGNSLGGLYSRYALSELDLFKEGNDFNQILPLVFCTTSSPHLGVAQETFIELPRWLEPYAATALQQQTMYDLFRVKNSTVIMDMCHNNSNENISKEEHDNRRRDYLSPLQQFQKRIAVANSYNSDFLVSVSSGAFLSSESDSVHYHPDYDMVAASSVRLMKDMEHVALQVVTNPTAGEETLKNTGRTDDPDTSSCVNSLDRLGWHKIFIDSRKILPSFLNLETPGLEPRATFTSSELKHHFQRYGTLLPVAHPLNMANSKTDWYRSLTKGGQPIVDALAELLVMDMVELSERTNR
mmetsp:Transcript_26474/g.78339  ORF Transcript_26474/g.78339 Transcript_26474/m.78339 type:complete len:454 (-) Transcript_26474:118-1479(-)